MNLHIKIAVPKHEVLVKVTIKKIMQTCSLEIRKIKPITENPTT